MIIHFKEYTQDYRHEWKNKKSLHDELTTYYYPRHRLKEREDINYKPTSLHNYMGVGSKVMNSHLWQQHGKSDIYRGMLNVEPHVDLDSHIKNLDYMINSHKTPKSMTVWSGTFHDPRELKDKNDMVHHPAYLSTSLLRNTAQNFTTRSLAPEKYPYDEKGKKIRNHHILKIHVPEGHHGIYASGIGYDDSEQEFILPRGTKMKYLRTVKKINNNHQYDAIHDHIHHMEVIPDDKS